jgi:TPR repeat protein
MSLFLSSVGDCLMSDRRSIFVRITIALVLSMVCLAAPAWADFKVGEKAYQRGDFATALREWQPLAKQGQAIAQYHLGLLYSNGQGVPKDDAQARQWYEKAANQEHADAQVNLGSLYDYGRGGPQDFRMAVRWYRRSANQGNDLAQRRLGLLYERGDGVPKDYVQAYMWYKLGAANGGKSGAIMRDELAIRMTSDQLAEANKLAREWKPIPYERPAH